MHKHLVMLALLASLAACVSQPAPSAEWTRWVCDSQVELHWRADPALPSGMQVRLGSSERIYQLSPEPAASGALYSNGVLALHTKGEQGLLYWVANNDLIGRDCKAAGK
ncbi:MAG: MliC family protein [Pseudomonas sp.]|nr:MliC family protein [Pseudomonas sp.]